MLRIRGEPGIGKTTLMREVSSLAHSQGLSELSTRAVQSESQLSLITLLDLLGDVPEEHLSRLPSPQRIAVDVALQRAPSQRDQDERLLPTAVNNLIAGMAQATPLVISIDDAQWIDPDSSTILNFALRRMTEQRLLIVTGERPGANPLSDVRTSLPSTAVTTLDLGPLPVSAIGELIFEHLDLRLPKPVLNRIHRDTGGNPLYAIEVARAIGEHGAAPGERMTLSHDLHDLLARRLAGLSDDCIEALLAISLLSRPSSELVRLAASEPSRADAGVREAIENDVVELTRGHVLRFTHPLLASTLLREIPVHRRAPIHLRLAEVVDDEEERARHRALGTRPPDEVTADSLERAAESAAGRGALDSAAELSEMAVMFTEAGDRDARHRRSLMHADHLFYAGDAKGAAHVLKRLTVEMEPSPSRAEVLIRMARYGGGMTEAQERLDQALAEAGDDHAVRAQAHVVATEIAAVSGDHDAVREHVQGSLDQAHAAGDPMLLASALTRKAWLEAFLGDPGASDTAESALNQPGAAEIMPVYEAPGCIVGLIAMWADDLDKARDVLLQERDRSLALGDSYSDATLAYHLAEVEYRAGRWDEAIAHSRDSSSLTRQRLDAQDGATYIESLILGARGSFEAAWELAERGLANSMQIDDQIFMVPNRGAMGTLELTRGRWTEAVDILAPLIGKERTFGIKNPSCFYWHGDLIEALVMSGDPEGADEILKEFEERAQGFDKHRPLGIAHRCRALIASSTGADDLALDRAERAVAHHRQIDQPFELARSLLIAGSVHRRTKAKKRARDALTEAVEIFAGLQATPWTDRAQNEIDRIGGRHAPATELTPTEDQVADLVAGGLTNKEVAERLFLSVKTVEANLSRVYRKLGLRSRSELVAQRVERDSGRGV